MAFAIDLAGEVGSVLVLESTSSARFIDPGKNRKVERSHDLCSVPHEPIGSTAEGSAVAPGDAVSLTVVSRLGVTPRLSRF